MKTKPIIILVCIAMAGCKSMPCDLALDGELRTDVEIIEHPTEGHIKYENTYRGMSHILCVTTKSNGVSRTFGLHGEAKLIEVDRDKDGFFEFIMIAGEGSTDFDIFRRKKDGSVEPVSKEEYIEIKKQAYENSEQWKGSFEN